MFRTKWIVLLGSIGVPGRESRIMGLWRKKSKKQNTKEKKAIEYRRKANPEEEEKIMNVNPQEFRKEKFIQKILLE